MNLHANAKLGPSGRYALIAAIEGGRSLRVAAAVKDVGAAESDALEKVKAALQAT
jgi:hypothetical protein